MIGRKNRLMSKKKETTHKKSYTIFTFFVLLKKLVNENEQVRNYICSNIHPSETLFYYCVFLTFSLKNFFLNYKFLSLCFPNVAQFFLRTLFWNLILSATP